MEHSPESHIPDTDDQHDHDAQERVGRSDPSDGPSADAGDDESVTSSDEPNTGDDSDHATAPADADTSGDDQATTDDAHEQASSDDTRTTSGSATPDAEAAANSDDGPGDRPPALGGTTGNDSAEAFTDEPNTGDPTGGDESGTSADRTNEHTNEHDDTSRAASASDTNANTNTNANTDNDADAASTERSDGAGPVFADLGLRPEILAALDELGYEEPTPIQAAAIPPMLEGGDLLGQAATGTGKTAAFALPILNLLESKRGRSTAPTALVLVPTRELAMQVSEAIFKYGKHLGVKVVPIYGGQPIYRQLQQLDRGVDVVVATPGRAVDHVGRGSLPLDDVRIVVLDEADEMLDMGFADDLETILDATPEERQTVLFSATMPSRINAIAKRYQRSPVRIQIGKGDTKPGKALIRQRAYVVQRAHKAAALGRILDVESPTAAIVFCRTRGEVDTLTVTMNGRGYRAEALHGGMDQMQRDRVMGRLRDGTAELLIATDVAARGLDVDTLTHVVNYDVPSAPESYVHRIGRVGRAGREGVAITLAEPREQRLLGNIERLTKQQISIETVPTVADLRARRMAATTDSVREALQADDLEELGSIVDELAADHDLRAIALAAIKLAHDSAADDDDLEIPDARRFDRKDAKRDKGRHRDRDKKPHRGKGQKGSLDERGRDNAQPTGYLYVAMGRSAGMRPGDLVGAIANESGLEGREIGPIRIADHYSVVGVPEQDADRVIGIMNGSTIRGKATKVRRYND
jgi:ATP-dependent RNA helicase DeaD